MPDNRDCECNSPELKPTDDRGCATNEKLPQAPSADDVRTVLAGAKFLITPKCQNAPEPQGVKVQNVFFDGLGNGQFSMLVDQESRQTPGCPVFYQLSFRILRMKGKEVIVSTSYADFVFRESDSKPTAPTGKRLFQISNSDPKLAAAMKSTIFDLLQRDPPGVFRLMELRIRTIAPNGLSSP